MLAACWGQPRALNDYTHRQGPQLSAPHSRLQQDGLARPPRGYPEAVKSQPRVLSGARPKAYPRPHLAPAITGPHGSPGELPSLQRALLLPQESRQCTQNPGKGRCCPGDRPGFWKGWVGLQEGGIQGSFLEFILGPGEGPLPPLVALTMHSSQRLATYYRA